MGAASWVVAVAGWTAAVTLLAAYWLLSTRRLSGESLTYQVLNVYGALGLMLAAWVGGVWPAVALNIIWAGIGAVALARLGRQARRRRQPAEPTPH